MPYEFVKNMASPRIRNLLDSSFLTSLSRFFCSAGGASQYAPKKHNKNGAFVFPEDCVSEILLKLPIKSILRFRCVSKFWYASSTSSYFVNAHMKLNKKKEFLLIDTEGKFLSFNLKDESFGSLLNLNLKSDALIGYCNGVVCFWSKKRIILLNPSMREFKVLPKLPFDEVNIIGCGFGFDDLNDDYKVILIISLSRKKIQTYEVATYNLRSNTWRTSKNVNTLPTTSSESVDPFNFYCSLFFNGRVHWNAHHIYFDDDHKMSDRHPIILSMDVSSEEFYELEYPKSAVLWIKDDIVSHPIDIQVIRGSLSIILLHTLMGYQGEGKYVHIWSMKKYGLLESWSKQYTIGPFFWIVRALPVKENEDEEDHLLLQIGSSKQPNYRPLVPRPCELVGWNSSKNEEVKQYRFKSFSLNNYTEPLFYSESLVSIR